MDIKKLSDDIYSVNGTTIVHVFWYKEAHCDTLTYEVEVIGGNKMLAQEEYSALTALVEKEREKPHERLYRHCEWCGDRFVIRNANKAFCGDPNCYTGKRSLIKYIKEGVISSDRRRFLFAPKNGHHHTITILDDDPSFAKAKHLRVSMRHSVSLIAIGAEAARIDRERIALKRCLKDGTPFVVYDYKVKEGAKRAATPMVIGFTIKEVLSLLSQKENK